MYLMPWFLQVEEETGIHLKLGDMVDLTAFLDPSTGGRVFPSPVSWHLCFYLILMFGSTSINLSQKTFWNFGHMKKKLSP